ncbi:MAG: polysaccharide biosynthesis protein, partial [Cellulophaga sp.]|nr:polysaccharide biosynthesis protein [Cellulophaga sp.]
MIKNYLTNTASRFASKWLVLCIDVVIVSLSFILSYFILFNLTLNFDVEKLFMQLPAVALIAFIAFLIIGSYKGVVRHTGVRDVYNIFNAICLFSIITILLVVVNRKYAIIDTFTVPLTIIIIHSLLSFIGLTSSRYIFKALYNSLILSGNYSSKNVLIYGAGSSGILTQSALTNSTTSRVKVIGYVDKDIQKVGKHINGVKVYGPEVLNEKFILQKDISEVIFSIQNIDHKKLRFLVESLVDYPVLVKIVPPVEDWINGELKLSQIKQVQIEDLLDRAPINIKNSKVSEEFKGKVIVVTGGAGSIGSELVRQICTYDYKSLIVVDQAES